MLCDINKIILEQIICVDFMRRLLCQCAIDRFFCIRFATIWYGTVNLHLSLIRVYLVFLSFFLYILDNRTRWQADL